MVGVQDVAGAKPGQWPTASPHTPQSHTQCTDPLCTLSTVHYLISALCVVQVRLRLKAAPVLPEPASGLGQSFRRRLQLARRLYLEPAFAQQQGPNLMKCYPNWFDANGNPLPPSVSFSQSQIPCDRRVAEYYDLSDRCRLFTLTDPLDAMDDA